MQVAGMRIVYCITNDYKKELKTANTSSHTVSESQESGSSSAGLRFKDSHEVALTLLLGQRSLEVSAGASAFQLTHMVTGQRFQFLVTWVSPNGRS